MPDVHLIYTGPTSIRLTDELPNSIYLDAENFLRQFQGIVDQMNCEKPLRKVMYRTGFGKTLSGWMKGSFHRWGNHVWENTEGQAFVPDTVGIIEDEFGNVYQVDPTNIQFVRE